VKLFPLKFFAIGAAAALLAGCAGYHLGPVNGAIAGEKSIEVFPFDNQTLEPRLGDSVTQALRERLQADATYHLATHGAGDVIVTGVITRYGREGLSYLNTDVATAENYRVQITAHVVVRDSSSGKVLIDKDVSGYTLVQVGMDLASADRQSQPLLAEELARNVAELLTEGAW
jgi:Lipopolysaccharide-assembly